MGCPFCEIIEKQAHAHVIYESENSIAFLDIDPINEGHILVVPKLHVASIDEIPIDILMGIIETLQKIVTVLKEIYHFDGYSIMQNGGEFCDFGHAHFHIFPRYKNDGFGWKYPEGPFECSDKVAEQIRNMMENNSVTEGDTKWK